MSTPNHKTESLELTPETLLQEIKLSLQLPQLIEQIKTHQLILKAATQAGIEPDVATLQAAADQMRVNLNLKTAADTYAWLDQHGLSMDDFEELVLRDCLRQQLIEQLFADKIESYFVQHQLDYRSAVLYEVVFEDDAIATDIYYALEAGETTFPQVAHQYIQDPEKRRIGGYLGDRRRSSLPPEIAAAIFAAHPPQLLKPIVLAQGVALIFVEAIHQPTLDAQLRNEIATLLLNEHLQQMATG